MVKYSHLQTCIKYDRNRDYVLQEDRTLTEGLVETAKVQKRHNLFSLHEHLSLSFIGSYDLIARCGLILLSLMHCKQSALHDIKCLS